MQRFCISVSYRSYSLSKVVRVAIFLSFGDSTNRFVDWTPGLHQFLFPANKFLQTCAPAKIMLHTHVHRVILTSVGTSQKGN